MPTKPKTPKPDLGFPLVVDKPYTVTLQRGAGDKAVVKTCRVSPNLAPSDALFVVDRPAHEGQGLPLTITGLSSAAQSLGFTLEAVEED